MTRGYGVKYARGFKFISRVYTESIVGCVGRSVVVDTHPVLTSISNRFRPQETCCTGEMVGRIRERLDAHWGWVVVAYTFLLFLVMYGTTYSYGLLFVEFQEEFGSSATLTGWVGSIPVAFTFLVAPPSHVLIERFGYRPVGFVSIVVSGVGLIVTSFMPSLGPMFATYSFMYGGGAGVLTMVSLRLIREYFPNKNLVPATGIAASGANVGMLVCSQLLSYLMSQFGWRVSVRIIVAVYFVVGCGCVVVFTPSKAKNHQAMLNSKQCANDDYSDPGLKLSNNDFKQNHEDRESDKHNCGDQVQRHTSKADDEHDWGETLIESACFDKEISRQVDDYSKENATEEALDGVPLAQLLLKALTYPEMVMISIGVLMNGVCDCFYYINTVSYMVSVGFSEADGAQFLSVIGAATTCGKLAIAVIAKYLPFPSYYIMVIVPVVGVAVMVSFMVVNSLPVMLFLAAVIGGVMVSSSALLPNTLPMEFFGPSRGRFTLPVYLCSGGAGYLLGSVIGQSIDRTGSYTSAIWAFIAMYVVIALLFIAAPLYQRRYAPHRYVLMDIHRLKRATKQEQNKHIQQL